MQPERTAPLYLSLDIEFTTPHVLAGRIMEVALYCEEFVALMKRANFLMQAQSRPQ